MAQISTENFDRIYKLLSDHNFAINRNIPDELKCVKCKNILVDACYVPCGCLYCHHCIEEMIETDSQVCPGSSKFCKFEQISNYHTDHRINRKILQLVVKCPEELCPHECELINMQEHLRLCSNKCIRCPFYGFGCDDDKWRRVNIGDHLQLEGFNHNTILIELIGNLRNEVNVLKKSDETNKHEIQKNQTQIEILKESLRVKDETIAVMNEDIQRNKQTIQRNKQGIQSDKTQIVILKKNSRVKDELIAVMQNEIELIKKEKQQMAEQKINLKKESNEKMENSRKEMTKEWRDNLGREVRKLNGEIEKWQLQLTKRADELEKWQDKQTDGTVVMKIDKISERRKKNSWICSPIFYPRIDSYKMQLVMANVAGSDELTIRLFIHAGENDAFMEWPFQRKVTFQISNKAQPNASKSIIIDYKINKPNNNSYNRSDPISFSYAELLTVGLMQDNYLIVECHFD